MPTVNSVLGPLDVGTLGFTLTHEHVYTASAGILQTYPELFGDFDDFTRQTVSTLAEARDGGVQTLVELSTLDLGRDVRFFADMSRRTGVNIIAATGIWRDIPRALWNRDPDQIAGLFVREIEVGIEGTGIRAGIIKVANDRGGVTAEGEVILRAAARAAMRTGAVFPHTPSPRNGSASSRSRFSSRRGWTSTACTSDTATTQPTWTICWAWSKRACGWEWTAIRPRHRWDRMPRDAPRRWRR